MVAVAALVATEGIKAVVLIDVARLGFLRLGRCFMLFFGRVFFPRDRVKLKLMMAWI